MLIFRVANIGIKIGMIYQFTPNELQVLLLYTSRCAYYLKSLQI